MRSPTLPPVAATGQWLCYRPRVFERGGRNYQVETGQAGAGVATFPGRVIDGFTGEAEALLRAAAQRSPEIPLWRYGTLGPDSPVALLRCAQAHQGGAQARVVWALLLPQAHVCSARFGLTPLPDLFPGADAEAPWPAPLDLTRAAPPKTSRADLSALTAGYLGEGRAEIRCPPEEAFGVLAGVIEQLAPRDRLEASFVTAPQEGPGLSVSDTGLPPAQVLARPEWLARLGLWDAARERLPAQEIPQASLRDPALGWLVGCLAIAGIPKGFAGMVRAVRSTLPAPLHEAAFADLRRALELALAKLPARACADNLASLADQGLLGTETGVPPMWLQRMALQADCLAFLKPALLARALDPAGLPMILDCMQRPSSLTRLDNLARAVGRGGAFSASLRKACAARMPEILAQGVTDATLAATVALLLLHGPATPVPGRDP